MKVTRRQILRMLGGTTLVAAGARRGWTATDKGPIRVGFLVPFTGPFAQSGKDMWDGFRLSFEEVGMRAAGHLGPFEQPGQTGVFQHRARAPRGAAYLPPPQRAGSGRASGPGAWLHPLEAHLE